MCVTVGLKRCWYSAEVRNEQTIAHSFEKLRSSAFLTPELEARKIHIRQDCGFSVSLWWNSIRKRSPQRHSGLAENHSDSFFDRVP